MELNSMLRSNTTGAYRKQISELDNSLKQISQIMPNVDYNSI